MSKHEDERVTDRRFTRRPERQPAPATAIVVIPQVWNDSWALSGSLF